MIQENLKGFHGKNKLVHLAPSFCGDGYFRVNRKSPALTKLAYFYPGIPLDLSGEPDVDDNF